MAVVGYGLGRFGDRRREKGGPDCMRPWWRAQVRVSVGSGVTGRARCSFTVFFIIRR
jgi:hypothetical protein